MKEWIKCGVIFAVGACAGAAASMTYFKTKYQRIADEEIESCRQAFKQAKITYSNKNVAEVEIVKSEAEPVAWTSGYVSTDDSMDYNDYYKPKKKAELEEAKTLKPVEEEIFEISIEDFAEDEGFDKVTLNYYTEDGVLIFEESEEIAIEERTIGSENLDDFVNSPAQSSYFRNPDSNVDYEVFKVDGSYKELIAGDI